MTILEWILVSIFLLVVVPSLVVWVEYPRQKLHKYNEEQKKIARHKWFDEQLGDNYETKNK